MLIIMSITYIPRVTQLDAAHLDTQLEDLIKQYIFEATKYLKPGILQPVLPELELLIKTWIFKHSVYNKKSTFGQQMLSLKYKTDNFSKGKLYWYYGYAVGLKYLKERAIYSFTSNAKLQNIIHKMEMFQVFADVMNFLRFIHSGKHPVLIDFILGLELVADQLTREDLTDLAWTRELLWHNLIELIGTTISIVNIFGLRRRLANVMKIVWWKKHSHANKVSGSPVMTIHTVCACCSNKPVLPHIMGCSHIFCYYCLKANKTADPDYSCPVCFWNGNEISKFTMT